MDTKCAFIFLEPVLIQRFVGSFFHFKLFFKACFGFRKYDVHYQFMIYLKVQKDCIDFGRLPKVILKCVQKNSKDNEKCALKPISNIAPMSMKKVL